MKQQTRASTQGDMRNAVNNLQSTFSGFGYVNAVRASVRL